MAIDLEDIRLFYKTASFNHEYHLDRYDIITNRISTLFRIYTVLLGAIGFILANLVFSEDKFLDNLFLLEIGLFVILLTVFIGWCVLLRADKLSELHNTILDDSVIEEIDNNSTVKNYEEFAKSLIRATEFNKSQIKEKVAKFEISQNLLFVSSIEVVILLIIILIFN